MTSIGNGRYELAEHIASGGMGEVWRGRDSALGRTVAVKLLHSSLADDPTFRTRFATEAQNAAALHDPRIATVFDYGDDVDPATGRHTTYLVMEYVDGRPLSELISAGIDPDRAAHLVAQAADGLAVAHAAGIVHRDVKPANFLVTSADSLLVTDFGIARAAGGATLTDTGMIMGTPHYVAPEVAEGRDATPASDVYSLGVVLYECLSGRRPFAGDSPVAVALAHLRDDPPPLPESVGAPMRGLVEQAMAKDPAARPVTAGAFASALRMGGTAAAGGAAGGAAAGLAAAGAPAGESPTQVMPGAPGPSTAPLTPVAQGADRPRHRRGWWPILAASAAVLAIAVLAFAVADNDPPVDTTSDDVTPTENVGQGQPGSPDATGSDGGPASTAPPETTAPTSEPPTSAPSSTGPGPQGVVVDPDDYIGADAKEAEEELEARGLDVTKETVDGEGEKDTVADVSPVGSLPPDAEVTLFVWRGEEGNGDKGPDDKPGPDGKGPDDKPDPDDKGSDDKGPND